MASVALLGALALSGLVACGDDVGPADAAPIDARPDNGTFLASWDISNGSELVECGDVGGIAVSIRLKQQDSFAGVAEAFACTAGQGDSVGIAPGIYDLTFDLRASMGRSLIESPLEVKEVEIVSGQQVELPLQTFVVAPTGNLTFQLNSQASGGNCAPESASGGAIEGFHLELKNSQGQCQEVEFQVGNESYTSACPGPAAQALPCVEASSSFSVNLPAGPHTLGVRGQKEGGLDCYERVSSFNVVGGGLTTDLGSLDLELEYSEECDPDFELADAGVADAGPPDGGP